MTSYVKPLRKYQELICNFQRRNRELLYKGSPNSVCLSYLSIPKECSEPAKLRGLFKPARLTEQSFVDAVHIGKLVLDDHFFMKFENLVLRRKINSLRNADDNFQKEFGISGAWFAGPFLLWRTKAMTGQDDIFVSPILKSPIDLKKTKSKNDSIDWEDAGTHQVNPTLRILLKKEYGVDLEKEYSGTLTEVITLILTKFKDVGIVLSSEAPEDVFKIPPKTKQIENDQGEKVRVTIPFDQRFTESEKHTLNKITTTQFVLQDVFYLDVFDASKMSLYYDYEEILEHGDANASRLIASLIDENHYMDEAKGSSEDCESENFYVVDIDGSQHRAIQKCQQNEGFVIQGPPGTGKSQTITNLISQFLAAGKKVLFVAEKRAALDVVYSRLCGTGLGKHSVILHDNEVNKSALYRSYVEAFNEKVDLTVGNKWSEAAEVLNIQSDIVEAYFSELSETSKHVSLTNYDFLALLANEEKHDFNHTIYQQVLTLSWDELQKSKLLIIETQKMVSAFGRYDKTYWKHFAHGDHLSDSQVKFFEDWRRDIHDHDQVVKTMTSDLETLFPEGNHSAIRESQSKLVEISDFDIAVLMMNNYMNSSKANFLILDIKEKVSGLKSKLSSFKSLKTDAPAPSVTVLRDYFAKPRSFLKYFSFVYWKMIKLAKSVAADMTQLENGYVYSDWLLFNQFEKEISESINLVHKSLKQSFREKDQQIDELDGQLMFANFILKIKEHVGGSRFAESFTASTLKSLISDFKLAVSKVVHLEDAKTEMAQLKTKTDSFFTKPIEPDFLNYPSVLDQIASSKNDFVQVQLIKRNLISIEKTLRFTDFLSVVAPVSQLNWFDVLNFHVMSAVKDKLFGDYPHIRLFQAKQLEAEIAKLNDLYEFHKRLSKSAVDFQVGQARLKTIVPNKIAKMIENEATKTRRVKSPREVMENGALEVMLEWKRCWLMSPLSISQVLPNTPDLFDVVIFDEASQVKLEDSIPSIYRAKTLVVVGDNKQMPPTNFFGGGYDDEDEEEFELAESLLDQAAKKYPSLMLEWHYRSEAESLIAFSNFAYYEGGLIVPPNPGTLCSSKAVEFIAVENGSFESKNGNEVEAQLIVDQIRSILLENPKASLGVISMGMSQQKAISKLIDELAEKDEKFAQALATSLNHFEEGSYKGFFNRNLENVQGDERDEIILSVGYGKNKVGKFRKAFGPLSYEGGGRRLNVAITRARKKMKVYCSFNPSDVPIDEAAYSANPNTTTFARFLTYAKAVSTGDERGALQVLTSFSNVKQMSKTENYFRATVAQELRKLGFHVKESIGNCGFVIDIGIFSGKDEQEIILGIEINKGLREKPNFLRDNFKNRNALLKNRGWNVYSLWIQDWLHDKEAVLKLINSEFKEREKKKTA